MSDRPKTKGFAAPGRIVAIFLDFTFLASPHRVTFCIILGPLDHNVKEPMTAYDLASCSHEPRLDLSGNAAMGLVLMSAERNADLDPVPLTLHVVICTKKPRVCSVLVFFFFSLPTACVPVSALFVS